MADSQEGKDAQRETDDLLSGFDRPQRPSRRSGPSSADFVDYHERASSEPIVPRRSRPLPRAKTASASIPKNELAPWVKRGALALTALVVVALAAWNLAPAPMPKEVGLVPTAAVPPVQASLPPPPTAIPEPEPVPVPAVPTPVPAPLPIAATPKSAARRDAKPPKSEVSAAPGTSSSNPAAGGYVRVME